jgi:hypothetical protein
LEGYRVIAYAEGEWPAIDDDASLNRRSLVDEGDADRAATATVIKEIVARAAGT